MNVLSRNHVKLSGPSGPPMMFSHGFGCDQNMWRHVAPAFAQDHRVVLFDHVGAGCSDLAAYDRRKYSKLDGYADDVIDICRALGLRDIVFVGHSVSAMIGVLAAIKQPELFSRLVLVAPSPRYLDDGDYKGGFSPQDIQELLGLMDSNYLGWSGSVAPMIMGNADRPALGDELTSSFCRTDPQIARHFAQVTFYADNRADLARLRTPSLILQCSQDVLAPEAVGRYIHRNLKGSRLVVMKATGHCPNLSAPRETTEAIQAFLALAHAA